MPKRCWIKTRQGKSSDLIERIEMRDQRSKLLTILLLLTFSSFVFAASQPNEEKNNVRSYETSQIVVAVTKGRVRSGPSLQSEILKESTIGTRFSVLEEKNGWSKIQLTESTDTENGKTGWISNSITAKYNASKPGVVYQSIANKYFSRRKMSFSTAKELYLFLPKAADEAKTFDVGGDLRLKSLMALATALRTITPPKAGKSPYKEFLLMHKEDVVYSEPAGEWYVRSEKFWQLHERYRKHKVGEKIAWHAAGNPTPGECEGYINCHLYRLRITHGEYLNFYPNGSHSKEALRDVYNMMQPIISDLPRKRVYYTASDISDRAEFNRMLADLRKIISKSPHLEKTKILKQINRIAEGHR